jgi:hypothetical protein
MTLLRRRGPLAKRTGLFRMLGHGSLNTAGGDGAGRFRAELAGSQGALPETRAAGNGGRTCRKICCYAAGRSGEFLRDRSEVRPAQKKGPGSRRGRCADASVGSLTRRFGSLLRSTGTGSAGLRFRFAAVEPAHGVRPNRPRGDLRGGGLLAFAGNLVNRT